MRKVLALLFLQFFTGHLFPQLSPDVSENYSLTRNCLDADCIRRQNTIVYIDGLGRPKQMINIKAAKSGKDLVVPIVYDHTGKQLKGFLPVPLSSLNGSMQPVDSSGVNSYYNSIHGNVPNAYSEVVLDGSPLNRIKQSAFPGAEWKKNAHSVKYDYDTNTSADEVKRFTTSISWTNYIAYTSLYSNSTYPNFQLYKTVISDEDGHETHIFKDKRQQTILIRKINADPDGSSENIDTYYVHNKYNQLVFIIPPLASAKSSLNQEDIDKLCYQYRYDSKGRLAEKKLPGKGLNPSTNQWVWESMVYDNQDRLIAVQDANLKLQGNKWLYTQYDQFSRVVATGLCNANGSTRSDEQDYADSIMNNNTVRSGNMSSHSGMNVYYTTSSYPSPSRITELLSLNYYDTYPTGAPTINSPVYSQEILSQDEINSKISTKSFPTASFVKNIGEDIWTKSYFWYDTLGRTIITHTFNHLGGFTKTENQLDFVGATRTTKTYHSRSNPTTPNIVVEENFTYDDQYRLVKHEHEVLGRSPKETLAEYEYDDLDQLKEKRVGGTSSPLQTVNYKYSVRGWLTDINNIDVMNDGQNDLFAYKIRYTERIGLEVPNVNYPNYKVKPKYNGNISEVDWKSIHVYGGYVPPQAERYGYVYDGLDRLKAGFYQNPSNRAFRDNHEIIEKYDKNGNIERLKRFGRKVKNYPPAMIDYLHYTYDGNRLTSIIDNPTGTPNTSGYEGGGGPIDYDANGNMTVMADKGITGITYNFLNLPSNISQNGNNTQYTYRADGTKLKRTFTLNNAQGTTGTLTEYLGGFHYTPASAVSVGRALRETDDATVSVKTAGEEEIFVDSSIDETNLMPVNPMSMGLAFFPTSEGFYDFRNKKYIYQYKDQVGNIRLSYARNPATNVIEVLDVNDYYPFGMNIMQGSEFSVTGSPLNYKFGGKELQESGVYDFGARNYMPDVGHWFNADPLAELSPDLSPYRFAFNNPINVTDPTGLYEDDYYGGGDYYDDYDDYDRGNDYAGYFNIFDFSPSNWDSSRSDLWNVFNFRWDVDFDISFGRGGEANAEFDFMQDMGNENFSEMGENYVGEEQGCCPDPPKQNQTSYVRQAWNYVADNIISKPIEGVQVVGYIFYGAFYALPKEAIDKGRIENLHVNMDIVTWGFKNGAISKNIYKDDDNMSENEKFDAFVQPGVEAMTAPISFGIKPFKSSFANWGFNTAIKTGVKKGIYQTKPKNKKK